MKTLTPIHDIDQKIDIMDHVNQDHLEELKVIAQANYEVPVMQVRITDMFQEGMALAVREVLDGEEREEFIPFVIDGELEEQILYLAYAAAVKQGKDLSGAHKSFFEVIEKTQVTSNMTRLTVRSDVPLPEDYAGFAYAFILKTVQKRPEASPASKEKSYFKKLSDRFFIWLMRHISSDKRQKLLMKANKDVRLYTLRKSWRDGAEFINHGQVDIFTHGNTQGSQWAATLNVGDIIMSRSNHTDKHAHLNNGQALLIADETAFPALAGIIEHWHNELPPHMILLTAEASEQDYFDRSSFPEGSHVKRIICSPEQQGAKVIQYLSGVLKIESVWAALEAESAKSIRHYLRNERHLLGKQNHTKAYWSLKSKRGADATKYGE